MTVKLKKVLAIFALVMALMLSTVGVTVFAGTDVGVYYTNNKNVVEEIDSGDYFLAFRDEGNYQKMEDMVEIATAYNTLIAKYKKSDYVLADWELVEKRLSKALSTATIIGEDFNKTAILAVIKDLDEEIDNYKTKADYFEEYKQEAIASVSDYYYGLVEINENNPSGTAKTIVGFYDTTSVNVSQTESIIPLTKLKDVYLEIYGELNKVVFTNTLTLEENKEEIDEKMEGVFAKLDEVPKNIVEVAISSLNDYKAIKNGDKQGDKTIAHDNASYLCGLVESFFKDSSNSIQTEYSDARNYIKQFLESDDESNKTFDLYKQSTLKSKTNNQEDGVVSITAYYSDGVNKDTEAKVFPSDSFLKIYSNNGSPSKTLAERGISELNSEFIVSYFMNISVTKNAKEWDSKVDGVYYQITIDLDKYFENYVKADLGGLAKLLKSIGIGDKLGTENKYKDIARAYYYIERSTNKDLSLCYLYNVKDDQTELTRLNAFVDDNLLIINTTQIGDIAVTSLAPDSVFNSPIFWIICSLLIIIIIVIIMLLIKKAKKKGNTPSDNNTNKGEEGDTAVETSQGESNVDEAKEDSHIDDYYKQIKEKVCSYELLKKNDKATDGKVILRLFASNKDVSCYFATDIKNDAFTSDSRFNDTNKLVVVNSQESLVKALEVIGLVMADYGFTKGDVVNEDLATPTEGRGFSYTIKYIK